MYANSNSLNYVDPRDLEGLVLGDPDFGGSLGPEDTIECGLIGNVGLNTFIYSFQTGQPGFSMNFPELGAGVFICACEKKEEDDSCLNMQFSDPPRFPDTYTIGFRNAGVTISSDLSFICYAFVGGLGPFFNPGYDVGPK